MITQMALFDLEDRLSNRSHLAVGALGEDYARRLLEHAGYDVATVGRQPHAADLVAVKPDTGQTWRVEVKTARRGKDGRYLWNLVKDDRHGHTDAHDADLVLLLAVTPSGQAVPFVIPVEALGELKTILMRNCPRAYAGRWARYRQTKRIILEVS